MGYKLEKHDPYVIEGKEGKKYEIPIALDMNLTQIEIMARFNKAEDEIEKAKLCKEFFLTAAPDLEDEGISDMEYFVIFQDYNKSTPIKKRNVKKMGES